VTKIYTFRAAKEILGLILSGCTFKRWFTCKMFASYRKSGSLTNLRLEVELMYLLRVQRHYRHKSHQKLCCAPEMTASLLENVCTEL